MECGTELRLTSCSFVGFDFVGDAFKGRGTTERCVGGGRVLQNGKVDPRQQRLKFGKEPCSEGTALVLAQMERYTVQKEP